MRYAQEPEFLPLSGCHFHDHCHYGSSGLLPAKTLSPVLFLAGICRLVLGIYFLRVTRYASRRPSILGDASRVTTGRRIPDHE
jgi:hypothetical protein